MPLSAGERTRRKILDAALALIDAEGVDVITHRRVGTKSGHSHGVVGYHFPTRDALIRNAFEHHLGSVKDYAAKIGWSEEEKLTRGRLIDLLTQLVEAEMQHASSIRIDLELTLFGTRNAELSDLFDAWIQAGVENLSSGLRYAGYSQPDRLASGLINLIRGYLIESLSNDALTAQDFRDRLEVLVPAKVSEHV